MPMLDMTQALTDPQTLDTFDVLRRSQSVSNQGRGVVVSTRMNGLYGVVTPTSPRDLQRLPDEELGNKSLTIITQFALRPASEDQGLADYYPDIVIWHGDNFLVYVADDYSHYAAGFIYAICTLMDLNQVPPETQNG